ncbi:MAG: hypothetical protein AB1631_23265 [Acidobacteriota bacterium]
MAKRTEFIISEAGCLIWVAPADLGGLSPIEFYEADLSNLVERGAMMPLSLYQDDGYLVRIVEGDLSEEEASEWTARARWKLALNCGEMIVSGILTPDIESEIREIKPAKNGGSFWAGCSLKVAPGACQVEIYSYPPGDLSGGWMQIEDPQMFKLAMNEESRFEPEEVIEYFRRTRPGEKPPAWIEGKIDETEYVNFIIRLAPVGEDLPTPKIGDEGCIEWEYRKPDLCPTGIRPAVRFKS